MLPHEESGPEQGLRSWGYNCGETRAGEDHLAPCRWRNGSISRIVVLVDGGWTLGVALSRAAGGGPLTVVKELYR